MHLIYNALLRDFFPLEEAKLRSFAHNPKFSMSKRLTGFLRIPNKLLACKGLSGNQKIVYAYLYGWKNGCTVTRDTIAEHLGMNNKTLDNVLSSLFELNLIAWNLPKSGAKNRRVLFVRQDAEAEASFLSLCKKI